LNDLNKYFKKCYQFQTCFVKSGVTREKIDYVSKTLQEKKENSINNEGYTSEEQFSEENSLSENPVIKRIVALKSELYYSNLIEFQVLIYMNSKIYSYKVDDNKILKIGVSTLEEYGLFGESLDFKYIILTYISLDILSSIGRNSLFYFLKESGVIRSKLSDDLSISTIFVNYNCLSHIAKLNVNSVIILDAIGVN